MLVNKSFIARVCNTILPLKKKTESDSHLCVCVIFAYFLFTSNYQRDNFHKVVTFPSSSYKSRNYGPNKSVTPLYAIGKVKRLPQKHGFTTKCIINFSAKKLQREIFFMAYLISSFVYITNFVHFFHFSNALSSHTSCEPIQCTENSFLSPGWVSSDYHCLREEAALMTYLAEHYDERQRSRTIGNTAQW